jgi:NAD(P)H dehydrogenase (quinone)
VAAGVHRLVYLSWLNGSLDLVFTYGRDHFATEQHIRASGIQFTFLRMPFYVDVIPALVGADGAISGPAGDGRVGAVLRDDIAESAVATLLGDSHVGKTYNLTGPEAFTFTQAADVMSRISGKSIRFHNETMDEAYASRAKYGAADWEVDGWVTTYASVAANELSLVSDDVRNLTGHDPVGLARYIETNPESLAHVVSS